MSTAPSQLQLDERKRFRATDLVNMDAGPAAAMLLERAAELNASDLFILSEERYVTISVRRLGSVERIAVVSTEHGKQLISFIKAHAEMDISERRRPADGRWILESGDYKLDMRINCTPTLHGEDMTIRIWNHSVGLLQIDQLGMPPANVGKLRFMLEHPSGLILVTGPTGTGKTTTLYACLQHLNDGTRKINTLEDPIEYAVEGVRQSQVFPKLGLSFPELLRNVLRQAPDVIMIGEIRDEETAATAVRAANSGHLVLATLHAPTAPGAVQSMLALGAHPYFFSGCLLGIVAQRLVRTLCPDCRVEYDLGESPGTFDDVQSQLEPGQGTSIYGASGCDGCFEVGYRGRTGLFEITLVNQEIRRLVAASASTDKIQQAAVQAGMITFRQAALLKVANGETSTEEILRDVPAVQLGLEE